MPVSVQESPAEVWVGGGLLQGQGQQCAWDLLKEVTNISITSTIVWSQVKQQGGNTILPINSKESTRNVEDLGLIPRLGRFPWRAWQPTSVFLPRESSWTEEPGRLQSMKSQRVGHDRVTKHTQGNLIRKGKCLR